MSNKFRIYEVGGSIRDEMIEGLSHLPIHIGEYEVPDSEVILGNTQCCMPEKYHNATYLMKSWEPKDFLTGYKNSTKL